MLLYSLQVIVKEKIQKITSSDFRRFILAITDGFTDELKSKINFHITDESFKSTNQRKIPYLLFAKPNDKSFRLFAYGEVGLEILEKIKEISNAKIISNVSANNDKNSDVIYFDPYKLTGYFLHGLILFNDELFEEQSIAFKDKVMAEIPRREEFYLKQIINEKTNNNLQKVEALLYHYEKSKKNEGSEKRCQGLPLRRMR